MFCSKCGTDIGNDLFCQKCGEKRVILEEMTDTTADTTTDTTTETQIETPIETQIETPTETLTGTASEENYTFGIEQPKKKPQKWLKIAGVIAAILVVLGTGIYFAYPMIIQIINPKAYAVATLKSTTSKLGDNINNAIANADFTAQTDAQEVSISLQLDKLDLKNNSILSDLSGNNVTMTVQKSSSDNVMAGTILLGKSNSTALSIEYYMENNNLKFKIPQLSSKTFSIDMSTLTNNTGSPFGNVFSIAGGSSNADIEKYLNQYSDVIKAVIQDVIKGLDTVIDNSEYTKTDSKTYESENGKIKVSVFDVVISEDAIKKGVIAIINNIFNDKELSSYVSMITIYTKQTKEDLISDVESANLGIGNIPFTIYINNKKQIIKAIFDFNKISGDDAVVSMEFIGDSNIYGYTVFNIASEDSTIKLTSKINTDGFDLSMDARFPDSTIYKNQTINCGIQGKYQISGRDTTATISKMYASGNYEGETFDIALSGNATSKSISSVTTKSSSFSNAIDIEYMTANEKKLVLTEVSNNIPKLKGKLPDKLIDKMNTYVNSALATLK